LKQVALLDPGPSNAVVLSSKLGVDVTTAMIALPFTLLGIWCAAFGPATPDAFEGVRGGWAFIYLYALFGPAGPAGAFLLFGVWFGSMGLGSAWRAMDRRPLLIADAEGVTFHPAFFNGFLPWESITHIKIAGSGPAKLEFGVDRRVWAVESPLSAKRVRLALNYLGLSHKQAQDLVPHLKRLQQANG
jgi:hypothetical protein